MTVFFHQRRIPTSDPDVAGFARRVSLLNDEDLKALGLEINSLESVHLHKLCNYVLPKISNVDVLGLVYLSPIVIRKMNFSLLLGCLEKIKDSYDSRVIGKDFYEHGSASLIVNTQSHDPYGLLNSLSYLMRPELRTREITFIPGDAELDSAIASHFSKVSYGGALTTEDFGKTCSVFRRVFLPLTLEAYIKRKLAEGRLDDVFELVSDLVRRDKIHPAYSDVSRKLLGDDCFVSCCLNSLDGGGAVQSIMKLSDVMGEATFHTPRVLAALGWEQSSESPPDYIKLFRNLGFDDSKLPILASFVCQNLDKATYATGNDAVHCGFVKDSFALAKRMGFERSAFLSFLENVKKISGVDADSSPSEVIRFMAASRYPRASSKLSLRTYDLLIETIVSNGINGLYEIAPDAPAEIVIDVLEKGRFEISSRKLIKLFPQAKARVIQNDLGM